LGLSVSEVYGVTTFYSFLTTKPSGKHVIRVCKSVPCCMKDAEMIIDWINTELEINPSETTSDGRFSFELTNCIGACDVAPSMLIDDNVYGHLTHQKISEILKSYD
jgi:NADH:ubiquinone oxidoreductase subunit E